MNYNKLNVWLGWIIFLIASITYLSTIEPTTSFWDCGEFIATAYKLEVGHPPGAPLFMIIARVFSVVAETLFGTAYVAMSVNVLSALCSSFSILFLFWTITAFAKKLATRSEFELSNEKIIAILGSGAVGALAYTFSDSFWFSAVEGEVYAMSSFFTAIVFWAIMKWDAAPTGAGGYKWIILIAYLMGLSIGVHLLNLLAIPAMAFVVYFKNYEFSWKGFISTGLISMVILGFIQAGIIPGTVKMLAGSELFFVNKMGLGFNSGVIIFLTLLGLLLVSFVNFARNPTMNARIISLVILGILLAIILSSGFQGSTGMLFLLPLVGAGILMFFIKEKSPVFSVSSIAMIVMLIGYSSFTMISIRSLANPPMDENNPENVFSMLSYLNREQYGDRPLMTGHYWMAPPKYTSTGELNRKDGDPVYMRSFSVEGKKGKKTFNNLWDAEKYIESQGGGLEITKEYIISDDRKNTIVEYDDRFSTFLPRMYSRQPNHVNEYIRWSGFEPKRDKNGRIVNMPSWSENFKYMTDFQFNWLYWRYFMWNFSGRQNDMQGHGDMLSGNWLSGINKIDEQKLGNQERLPSAFTDNKGYNKFYMIPFLIGLIGFFFQAIRDWKNWWVLFLLFFFGGIAIMIYLNSYPYQPRERDYAFVCSFYAFALWIGLGVYALFDMAKNLSQSELIKVAGISIGAGVLYFGAETVADNSHVISYSMLYLAIVGVGLIVLMKYLLGPVKDGKVAAFSAVAIGLVAPFLMVNDGWDDHTRAKRRTGLDFAKNYLNSCEENAIIFTNGDNDTFPLWYAQEVEEFRTDIRVVNLSLLNTDWYIDQCKRKAYTSDPVPFSLEEPMYRQGTRDAVYVNKREPSKKKVVDVRDAIKKVAIEGKSPTPYGQYRVLDSDFMKLPIDRQAMIDNGIVSIEDSAKIADNIEWQIKDRMLYKNNLMMLDLLANFDWKRPIYYAVTTGPEAYMNLDPYFELTGLAYRLTPIKHEAGNNPMVVGGIDTEKMFDNVMNKFSWGNMDKEEIYMDENNRRMTNNLRIQMSNLAETLKDQGQNDKARQVLDKTMEVMPAYNVPYNRFILPIISTYAAIGDHERAMEIATDLLIINEEKMDWLVSLKPEMANKLKSEIDIPRFIVQSIEMMIAAGELKNTSEDITGSCEYIKMKVGEFAVNLGQLRQNKGKSKKIKSTKM